VLRKVLNSKIHRATVTRSDLNYEGSIAIDERLIEAAGLLTYEAVSVWNINNGERFETYLLPAPRGSGEICLNGAAARLAQCGDLVIVSNFCWMEEAQARQHHATVVLVDDRNAPLLPTRAASSGA
jgi:aspartate 1-decarboxylase